MVNDNLFPHEVVIRHAVTHSGQDLRVAVQFMQFVHDIFGIQSAFLLDRKRYTEDGYLLFYWRFQNASEAVMAKMAWESANELP